jgi:hypothetical protein
MGTCCARPQVPDSAPAEEKILSYFQNTLKYHLCTPEAIVEAVNKNCNGNLVTTDQLNAIGQSLSLNLADLDMIDSKIFRFYRPFIAKGSNFDARKLKMLGILLSKGSVKAKITLYFDLIPGVEENQASDNGLRTFLEDLTTIAAVHIPLLAIEETPAAGQSFSREQYEDYRDKLLSGKDAVVARFMTAIMGRTHTIAREKFGLLGEEQAAVAKSLTSAFALRTEMVAEANNATKGGQFKTAFQGFSTTLAAGTKK